MRPTCAKNSTDLLCVEWDVKPYTLTHSTAAACIYMKLHDQIAHKSAKDVLHIGKF